jgi:transposase
MESEKQIRFIELRATGQSYDKIAKQLSVSKTTLMEWSKEYCNEIKNAKALEFERIREEFLLGREHRTRVLGTQLNRITKEILTRDLSEVATHRLFDMQRKVIVEIEKGATEIEFTIETRNTPAAMIDDFNKKTVKWIG